MNLLTSIFLFGIVWGDQVIPVPVTFYKKDFTTIPVSSSEYDYFKIEICPSALQGSSQMKAMITLSKNAGWDPRYGVNLIQISNTKDSFGPNYANMTIQNFKWNTNPLVVQPGVIIDFDKLCTDLSNCTLYARVRAYTTSISYVMSFTFVNGQQESYFPYQDGAFNGPIVSGKNPDSLLQYWRTVELVTATQYEFVYFLIGFCNQGNPVTAIQVAVEAPLGYETTIIQTLACSLSNPNYQDCNDQTVGWPQVEYPQASVNIMTCDAKTNSLEPGIIVRVQDVGPGINGNGTFTMVSTLQR